MTMTQLLQDRDSAVTSQSKTRKVRGVLGMRVVAQDEPPQGLAAKVKKVCATGKVSQSELVAAALAQLTQEEKVKLVLMTIPVELRKLEGGLRIGMKVQFNVTAEELEELYPDHVCTETYTVLRTYYSFQMPDHQESVVLLNKYGKSMGHTHAKFLKQVHLDHPIM